MMGGWHIEIGNQLFFKSIIPDIERNPHLPNLEDGEECIKSVES